MISDAALFGLTRAQEMEQDRQAEAWMYGGLRLDKSAVRDDDEAAEYTAEIMEMIGAEQCVCGRWYLPNDCPLCDYCLAYENQAWRDHQDEVATALAATNGTL